MIKHFSLNKVQKGGAIFDTEKLNWFNCEYIKQKPDKELIKLVKKFLPNADDNFLGKIIRIEKQRINSLSEICEKTRYFFSQPNFNSNILIFKKSDKAKTLNSLKLVLAQLTKLKEAKWKIKHLHKILEKIVKLNQLTNGDVFWPTRVAVSGLEKSPSPEEIIEALGKEESLTRIKKAIDKLT